MAEMDLRPAALQMVVYYKGDVSCTFTFTSGGSAYNLTGHSASFVISEKNGTAALSLSGGSGLTLGGAAGTIDLAITNAQIVALASQEYNYEFSLTTPGGAVWPIMDSVFIVSEDGQSVVDVSDVSVSLDGTNVDVSVIAPGGIGPGGGTWGSITGTLSDQTDLQTALDSKVDENAAIVAATKTKITYDTKGLVTAGADAAIADITGLQDELDGKAAASHTHSLEDITESGATSGQVPKWNGAAWVAADDDTGIGHEIQSEGTPLAQQYSLNFTGAGVTVTDDSGNDATVVDIPGGGGGAVEIIDITYADMATAIGDATLTPGQFYRITDATGTDLGFICQAVRENEITVSGTGGYINADFQAVGDYGGVDAQTGITAGTQLGIWRTSFEALTIAYTDLSGGTFAVGDTITGGNTGATAVILTDDGGAEMTAYMTSRGVAFDGSEQLDNGNGVTADQDGAATGPTIQEGDIVIWNLLHYQLTNPANLDGTDPATNTSAYELLEKAWENVGYVTAWDVSEFDFSNNWIQFRADSRGNKIRYSNQEDTANIGLGFSAITIFQFGRDSVYGNVSNDGFIDIKNKIGVFYRNELGKSAVFQGCTIEDQASVYGNILEQSAGIISCVFSLESGFSNNYFYNASAVENCVFRRGTGVQRNLCFPGAYISLLDVGEFSLIENNILENSAQLTDLTTGASCTISRNTFGKGCTFGTDSTLADNCTVNDNVLGASAEIINITLAELSTMNGNNIGGGGGIRNIELQAGGEAQCSFNNLSTDAFIDGITMGAGGQMSSNIVKAGGTITGITAGENCSIQRNEVGQGATLGGTTTMGAGAEIIENDLHPNSYISENVLGTSARINGNIVFASSFIAGNTISEAGFINDNFLFSNAVISDSVISDSGYIEANIVFPNGGVRESQLGSNAAIQNNQLYSAITKELSNDAVIANCRIEMNMDEAETITESIENKRAVPGYSDIPTTIEIDGVTTLDITAAKAQYCGIINVTSPNSTESIDQIDNPPTAFPFTIRPAAGLVLTITGTAYSGIAAGQIALKATDYTLDGDKGEYIVLEIDPLGTGALIEKQVVNGLI